MIEDKKNSNGNIGVENQENKDIFPVKRITSDKDQNNENSAKSSFNVENSSKYQKGVSLLPKLTPKTYILYHNDTGIRGLAETFNQNSTTLEKAHKPQILDSIKFRSTMIRDTFDTNDTNDTDMYQKYQKYRVSSRIKEVLGVSPLDQCLTELFITDSPLGYDDLADRTECSKEYIKTVFSRNKELFKEAERIGNVKKFSLSEAGLKRVVDEIENHEQINLHSQKSLSEEEERLRDYKELVNQVKDTLNNISKDRTENSIYLDFQEISQYSPALAETILENPDLVNHAIRDSLELFNLHVRIKNLPESTSITIEDLRDRHIDKLVSIEARCVSQSSVRPIIKSAKFECPNCGAILSSKSQNGELREPSRCSCQWRGSFKLLSTEKVDGSYIMLEDIQEKTDNPHLQRIKAIIENDLTKPENVGIFAPGNQIKAVGIYREEITKKKGAISTNVKVHFEILNAELFEEEVTIDDFKEEEVEDIKNLASRIHNEGMEVIRNSFAPYIHGYNEIKDALLFQLACRKNSRASERHKPHILMIGDPGVAKSELGRFSLKLTSGARKAVGGSSSGVGITASVVKEDEELGGYRLEPGALPLAREILFLDEFNNMSDEDKPKLQEGMSENVVTVNKANIHQTLKVTAGIIASANPKHGVFDIHSNIIDQFQIPIPIMNRFDLIFVMRDHRNAERDKEIIGKMLSKDEGIHYEYSPEFLKKFLTFVRFQPEPIINKKMQQSLQDLYSQIRAGTTDQVLINPRFAESLKRLIKASAKLRLSNEVEEVDIQRAMKVISVSHYNVQYEELMHQLEAKR